MWNGHTGECISIFQAGSGKVCGHSFAPRPDILAIVAGGKLIIAKVGIIVNILFQHLIFSVGRQRVLFLAR